MKKLGNLFSSIFALIWAYIPRQINRTMAVLLGILWFDILRIRRDVIFTNLKRAFPDMEQSDLVRIGRSSVIHMCRSFVDVLKVPSVDRAWIDKNVVFEGQKNIEAVRAYDGGLFFLTLHLGSGDLGAAVVSEVIRPATLISKRFRNRFLDAFWFGLREKSKTRFIDAHAKSNAFDILAALKSKRGVIFVLDQFMGKPYGVETTFFGVSTGTAYGLALFAKKTKHPVYPLYTYWGRDQKLHICMDEAIDLNLELSQTNEEITEKFNRALEKIIIRHPEHWMWVHKRWKTFE